jgi:cbb3-type cytochrome oxidase maturation protein
MEIIYVLIPLSILLMILAVGAFFWAVRNDQFDDLDTPALDILDDDDKPSGTGANQGAGADENTESQNLETQRRKAAKNAKDRKINTKEPEH